MMDVDQYEAIRAGLQSAALDATLWPDLLQKISTSVNGAGALLISTDHRWKVAPCSPDLGEMHESYFEDGWYKLDSRYRGLPLMLSDGVASEPDFISREEIERTPFYRDFLDRHGRRWFGGVGFKTGDDLWCLSVQRATAKGPFQAHEIARLRALWRPLGDAATLSRTVGHACLAGMTRALDLVGQAGFICNDRGRILDINEAALDLLRAHIDRDRHVSFADTSASASYAAMLRAALSPVPATLAETATCLVSSGQQLRLRAIRLDGHAKLLFSGAELLILVRPEQPTPELILRREFGLTNAETRVALALASGTTMADMARTFTVRPETIRTQLKAIYAKTETSSQAQLVALVARLTSAGRDGRN